MFLRALEIDLDPVRERYHTEYLSSSGAQGQIRRDKTLNLLGIDLFSRALFLNPPHEWFLLLPVGSFFALSIEASIYHGDERGREAAEADEIPPRV